MTNKKTAKKKTERSAKTVARSRKQAIKALPSRKTAAIHPVDNLTLTTRLSGSRATLFDKPVASTQQTAPAAAAATRTGEVSGEELYNRIQFKAYLLAEKDGFKADPVHYWVQAERAVKAEIRHPADT